MKKIHLALTGITLTLIALSINRLSPWTSAPLQPHEFLRVLDLNQTLIIPLVTVLLYFVLKQAVIDDQVARRSSLTGWLELMIFAGIFVYGVGNGMHDVTNYLDHRFCYPTGDTSQLCQIIGFNDDQFSNTIYYIGFLLMNLGLLVGEWHQPNRQTMKKLDFIFITVNAIIIGLAIFVNLAHHNNLLHIGFFCFFTVLTLVLLIHGRRHVTQLPVTYYLAVAYISGTVGTLISLI